MKTIKCDICKSKVDELEYVEITFLDGEHPHCGSTMHKTADVCFSCANRLNLEVDEEFDDVVLKFKNGKL